MKILYHHRIASKDGQYVHVEELTQALSRAGHEIIMVAPAGAESSEFGGGSKLIARLKGALPKFAYELMELAYAVIAYTKMSIAVRRHDPDCIYERYNLFSPAGIWIKKRYGLPLLSEVNAPLLEERSKYGGIALARLARWSERYVWRNADRVLPVTEVLAGKVRESGVPPSRIEVIPNGIDPARFSDLQNTGEAKRRLGLEGKEVLGFTGFMREWHGLERVLDLVAADTSGRRFALLIGDGPARPGLNAHAERLGIGDRVRITGVIARDELPQFIAAFDIALQPSVVPYASPLKLFEYMALGKAIVAPDTPNIREVLAHEENALLFAPDSGTAFSDAVESLLLEPERARRLGIAAGRRIEEGGFTWDHNASRVIRLFRELGVGRSVGPVASDYSP